MDIYEAVKWFELSANGHLVDAYWILDKIYKENAVYDKVIYWGNRFVEYGFPQAMLKMGTYYMQGSYVERDQEKGMSLIRKAAETGFSPAQYELGRILWDSDREHAEKLINAAAMQNYGPAIDFIGAGGIN